MLCSSSTYWRAPCNPRCGCCQMQVHSADRASYFASPQMLSCASIPTRRMSLKVGCTWKTAIIVTILRLFQIMFRLCEDNILRAHIVIVNAVTQCSHCSLYITDFQTGPFCKRDNILRMRKTNARSGSLTPAWWKKENRCIREDCAQFVVSCEGWEGLALL